MLDPGIGMLISAALALLFLSAAWHKLRARAEFEAVLAAYRLFPSFLVPALSWLTPAAEVTIATGLLIGPTRWLAAPFGCALLLTYATSIAINLGRGRRDLDCGCAGPNDRRPIAPWMVVRNLLLAAALSAVTLRWSDRPLELTDALTIGGGLAAAAILYHAIDALFGQIMPRGLMLRRLS